MLIQVNRAIAQFGSAFVWGRKVVGSNPASPTINGHLRFNMNFHCEALIRDK